MTRARPPHSPHEGGHGGAPPRQASAVLVVLAVSALCAMPVRDLDAWWHLATGRLILQAGIPKADPFSFVLAGAPWVSFEWLSQLLFWGAWSAGGAPGLILLKASVVSAAFLLVWRVGRAAPAWSALLCVLAAAAARPWLVERPFVFDLLGIAVAATVLSEPEGSRRRWLLVPLTALWANLHGAAALAAPAMALALGRRGLGLAGASAAAVLANPHGWGVLEVAWRTLAYPGKELIKEWNPPWNELRGPLGLWALAALASLPRAWRAGSPWAAWTAGALAAALWTQRSAPLLLLCAPACVAAAWTPRAVRFAPAAALALGAVAAAMAASPRGWRSAGFGAEVPLSGAAAFLERESVPGPLFNEYESGGPLIFHGVPVFVDGRNAEYPPAHLRAALSWHRPEVWSGLEARWGFKAALVRRHPTGAWTTKVLDDDPSWRLAYWDDEAMVYLKDVPENARRLARLGYRLLYPGRGHHQWAQDAPADALLEELRRSTGAAPGSVNARLLLSYVLTRAGRAPDAVAEARAAAALAPGRAHPLASLGWALEAAGDLAGAEAAYARAARAAAREERAGVGADVLNNLGRLAERRGDRRAAAALYRKALSWNRAQGDALANLRRLEGF